MRDIKYPVNIGTIKRIVQVEMATNNTKTRGAVTSSSHKHTLCQFHKQQLNSVFESMLVGLRCLFARIQTRWRIDLNEQTSTIKRYYIIRTREIGFEQTPLFRLFLAIDKNFINSLENATFLAAHLYMDLHVIISNKLFKLQIKINNLFVADYYGKPDPNTS